MVNTYSDKMKQGSAHDRILSENNPSEREYYKKNNFVGWLIFFLAIAFLIYIFFYSPAFEINSVIVSGKNSYSLFQESQIKEEAQTILMKNFLYIFPQKNIFLLRKKTIRLQILSHPEIENISIVKKMPHTITITINGVKPVAKFIIKGDDREYFLTQTGKLITDRNLKPLAQPNNLPVIYDKTNDFTNNPEYSSSIKSIIQIIGDPILAKYNIKIKNLILSNQNNIFEIRMNAQNNWQFIFNASIDVEPQLKSLNLVLKEKNIFMTKEDEEDNGESNDTPNNYIDLRFGEKIFYHSEGDYTD